MHVYLVPLRHWSSQAYLPVDWPEEDGDPIALCFFIAKKHLTFRIDMYSLFEIGVGILEQNKYLRSTTLSLPRF